MPQPEGSDAVSNAHSKDSGATGVEDPAFDSFNEDLVWILDKLVHRAGGQFGMLSGHVTGEAGFSILARSSDLQGDCDALLAGVAAAARTAISHDNRRRSDDTPLVQQRVFSIHAPHETPYRALQLPFLPARDIGLVASVCKPSRFAFNFVEEHMAARLYPVLSRYVRLWWMHRMERRRASSLTAALDLLDVGVLLLDRRADLLFANTRAGAFLEQHDGIRRNEKSICAEQGADGFRLQAAIQHALQCNRVPTREGAARWPAPVLSLSRRNARRALILTVFSVERPAVDVQDPAVIVYALDPDQSVEQLLAPVCGLYKLTGAETRLVFHLVSGMRVADAAERMHVQPDTARAYLKQVFAKTRTHRQAELVRVMLSSAMRTNAKVDLALV